MCRTLLDLTPFCYLRSLKQSGHVPVKFKQDIIARQMFFLIACRKYLTCRLKITTPTQVRSKVAATGELTSVWVMIAAIMNKSLVLVAGVSLLLIGCNSASEDVLSRSTVESQ